MRRLIWFTLLTACGTETEAPRAPVPVPKAWQEVRDGWGHDHHLKADIRCANCHFFDAEGFVTPGVVPCANCHLGDPTPLHLEQRSSDTPACLSCHPFRPEPYGANDCLRCHQNPTHPGPQLAAHASIDCLSCHQPHQGEPTQAVDCARCHDQPQPKHGPKGDCLSCHQPHGNAFSARCESCHQTSEIVLVARPVLTATQSVAKQIPATATFSDHSCSGCHAPHDGGLKDCATCHDERPLAPKVPEHSCVGCHDPHQVKASEATCRRCHQDQAHQVEAPSKRDDHGCLSCHPPHQRNLANNRVTCVSCHPTVPAATRAMLATQIVAPPPVRLLSDNLHQNNCQDCHQPHAFSRDMDCGRCHQNQGHQVFEGHQKCVDCHLTGAHLPEGRPLACGRCHEPQWTAAPPGHLQCQQCHQPHSGQVSKTCAECHQAAQKSPHGQIAQGCAECHAPHGKPEKEPLCQRCHEARPGLHAARGHGQCDDCHGAHDARPSAARGLCIKCHQAQHDHEPQASACSACHPFQDQNR